MTKKSTKNDLKNTSVKRVKRKDIQVEDITKELEVIDKTNYRNFMLLLYEDTKSYNYDEVIEKLTSYKKFAYIKHIPETNEKKAHIHFILCLDNKTSISSISKKTSVPAQFIQSIKDIRQSCRYLCHHGWTDKIQYSVDSVIVSDCFKKEFNRAYDDIETEDIIIKKILGKIVELKDTSPTSTILKIHLLEYLSIENYSSTFKKFYSIFSEFISSQYIE